MILRVSGSLDTGERRPGWTGFAESQKLRASVAGYVTQPAHGALDRRGGSAARRKAAGYRSLSMTISAPARTRAIRLAKSRAASASEM